MQIQQVWARAFILNKLLGDTDVAGWSLEYIMCIYFPHD